MSRRSIIIGAGLVAVLGVGASAAWFYGAYKAEQAIVEWAETLKREGDSFVWDSLEISGFPYAFDGHLTGPELITASDDGVWHWRADALVIQQSFFTPNTYRARAPGRHLIEYTAPDGDYVQLGVETYDLSFVLHEGSDDIADLINLKLSGLTIDNVGRGIWSTGYLEFELKRRVETGPSNANAEVQSASMVALLRMDNLIFPSQIAGQLNPRIDQVTLNLALAGALNLWSDTPVTPAELAAWRDDGGFVQLRQANLLWGPLDADVTGRFELDNALQPAGDFRIRATGLVEAITAMEQAGAVGTGAAWAARLSVLGLNALDTGPPEEGEDLVEVPLTLENRTIFLGPISLFRLPAIHWPAGGGEN